MITCEVKDKVLYKLVNDSPNMFFVLDMNETQRLYGESKYVVSAILDDFEKCGLIKNNVNAGAVRMLDILVPAHDLISHGGFTAQEELLTKNIQKLILEIESLKPSIPDKVEKITSIVSGIASALSLFISK